MWQVYAAGSMAGLAQAAPVTAAEYCKTQMQLQVESREQAQHNYLGRTHGASGRMLFKSSVDCFMYNVKTHGMASVFRGARSLECDALSCGSCKRAQRSMVYARRGKGPVLQDILS